MACSVLLLLIGASFLEQLLDGGCKMWISVHLPRQRRRVSAVWRSGISEECGMMDSCREEGALFDAVAAFIGGQVRAMWISVLKMAKWLRWVVASATNA